MFENCKVVKGAQEIAICDLQFNEVYKFPLALEGALNKIRDLPHSRYVEYFSKDELPILQEFLDYLVLNNLGHFSDCPDIFIPMPLEWDFPGAISNAIIEIGDRQTDKLEKILFELNMMGCKSLELRVLFDCVVDDLEKILEMFKNSAFQSINILCKKVRWQQRSEIQGLFVLEPRIMMIAAFGCESNDIVYFEEDNIFYQSQEKLNINSCGKITFGSLNPNIKMFTESLNHNSCLNRKISIDSDGNIKNCPSMKETFGNIVDTTLTEAVENPDFKKYWNINKDKIHVCKDCEFRYICTDCRAYVDEPEDILSKPLKCGYNPYKGEWGEWSTNPLKQKAIDFYGMRGMVDGQ